MPPRPATVSSMVVSAATRPVPVNWLSTVGLLTRVSSRRTGVIETSPFAVAGVTALATLVATLVATVATGAAVGAAACAPLGGDALTGAAGAEDAVTARDSAVQAASTSTSASEDMA